MLIYSLNYAPELTGIGKYSGEMAAWLAAAGHEVRVITAPPYYPDWKVSAGYSAWRYSLTARDNVLVWRAPLWVPAKPSGLKRLLHLASFAASSFPLMLRQMFWRPDVVWVVAPALACVPGALLCARLSGAKAWLHVQDYEVDAAFDMGLVKGRGIRKMALGVERWLMRRFDRFSTISGRMLALAHGKGVDADRAVLFPNWVDLSAIAPPVADAEVSEASGYRGEWGVSREQLVALYSGNMGGKQGLEVLADTARLLSDEPGVQFIFCGNGAGRADLESRCEGLPNVRFLDLQPLERLGELLGAADIHLLPQRADAADLVMPSKLTGMLASGRAVIATANPGTELAAVVEGCGLVVPPESPAAMAGAIRKLMDEPGLRLSLGAQGRRYAEEHIDKQTVLSRFEKMLVECRGAGAA
nr:glycosyltransferase WbuB [Azoarcus sp. L1K30]